METSFRKADEITRRNFIANIARASLGVSMLPIAGNLLTGKAKASIVAPSNYATAKRVIYLYMEGGMSHLDTFSPKPESKEVSGPVNAIASSADGVRISEYLPRMAKLMHHAAVIESMNSNQGAHLQGRYYMHTNYTMRGTIKHPGFGAWVSKLSGRINPTLPPFIVINGGSRIFGAGYMETKYGPLPIGDPSSGLQNSVKVRSVSEASYRRRLALTSQMNQAFEERFDNKKIRSYRDVYDDALTLMKSEDLKAFDISDEPEYIKEAYGEDAFGRGCLLARRLAEHNVRFIEVKLGGWDTHNNNFERVPERAEILDQGMSALIADLESRGMLEDTLVVLATEFGRTPDINGGDGRDHYPQAFSCVLAGGGVRGGQIYGKTDKNGKEIVESKVRVTDLNATIAHAMGLPHEEVIHAPNGRPFTLGNKGKPIAIF